MNDEALREVLGRVPTSYLIHELQQRRAIPAEARQIIRQVAKAWQIPTDLILNGGREAEVAQARQAAMVIIRDQLPLSFSQIGKIFRRDHGTVMHACKRHETRMTDLRYARRYHLALASIYQTA